LSQPKPGIWTYESRGNDTKEALDPSAGTCTRIMVSVFRPALVPVFSSAACALVRLARLSLPTSSRFIAAPPPFPSLPEVGIASVRLTLASATRPRYQPHPLAPSTVTATSAAARRVPIASRFMGVRRSDEPSPPPERD
jgi:hypothetical protein